MAGFSLIELLTVIAIIVVLLTLGGSLLWQGRSRSAAAGATLASCIDFARSHAVARNRTVWLRLAPDRNDPATIELRFFRGTAAGPGEEEPEEFRRPVRLEQMMFRSEAPDFGGRPDVEMPQVSAAGATLILLPGGEIGMQLETEGFPGPPDELVALMEICVQATRGGNDRPVDGDIAAVQIQGLSGMPVLYKP